MLILVGLASGSVDVWQVDVRDVNPKVRSLGIGPVVVLTVFWPHVGVGLLCCWLGRTAVEARTLEHDGPTPKFPKTK